MGYNGIRQLTVDFTLSLSLDLKIKLAQNVFRQSGSQLYQPANDQFWLGLNPL